MALKTGFLLFLLGLALFVCGGTAFCNVTCWTNYKNMVNCSCSASLPVLIEVSCSDGFESEASSSCEVRPPQSWCAMYPEDFDEVTYVGTTCNTTATLQDGGISMNSTESSIWELSHVVKAEPPIDVHVTNSDGFYNITWDHANIKARLTYRVRVRESEDTSKVLALSDSVKGKYILIEHGKLQPAVNYTVDVGAKIGTENHYWGPWSEWSSSAEWRTAGCQTGIEEMNRNWLYALLSIILVLGAVVYSQKTYLQKKFHLITYVPTPDEFFSPLYHNYGGNFKEWVKPVFSECDYIKINAHAQEKSEKQPDVLQWKNEKQGNNEDSEATQAAVSLHMLLPHSKSLPSQDSGISEGPDDSSGHISIHTVMLSGEDEFEEEVGRSVGMLRGYQDGGSFGSFGDNNGEHAGYNFGEAQPLRLDRISGMLPQHEIQIFNEVSERNDNFDQHNDINEPERVSLNSFGSHGLSEDGYPHVDLDTIDSGFGECSSPGASDSNMREQMDLFQEHKSSNSNYVKQWMICSTIQEDSSNPEIEPNETQ
ncbi:interleukin 21 receptor, tandem duplicate 1 [Cheilinus undulatus]|uniref:interleukin 21 receptor, tandem duplicate 1 n=1 Tax=Cheilinus undulatus TaxID=241271 RepID=UPI001BD56C82|nr:interleukin 21 receptor, tandem duplicate 1 [Cheilinus undulatus]XP_041649863.1 interleukin 21 receptor, tandem duplicate 1 [Cheilinus undulatus]